MNEDLNYWQEAARHKQRAKVDKQYRDLQLWNQNILLSYVAILCLLLCSGLHVYSTFMKITKITFTREYSINMCCVLNVYVLFHNIRWFVYSIFIVFLMTVPHCCFKFNNPHESIHYFQFNIRLLQLFVQQVPLVRDTAY